MLRKGGLGVMWRTEGDSGPTRPLKSYKPQINYNKKLSIKVFTVILIARVPTVVVQIVLQTVVNTSAIVAFKIIRPTEQTCTQYKQSVTCVVQSVAK